MRRRLGLVAVLLAVSAPGAVRAGAAPNPQEAFDLLAQEQVVTANKRPLPLAETPSSVTVIPAAEIRAMGYRTLAEALQYVRGLYVSSDRNYSYLGVRGIRRPGDYNDKVLVTLDGHTMNGSAFGDAAIGRELGLDMENVERIEIVRGPGSTLYGSNAVFAVINVITRGPGSEPGLRLAGRYGGWNESEIFSSFSGTRTGDWAWRLSGSVGRTDGRSLYFPAYDSPSTNHGLVRGADGERQGDFFGVVEWRALRLAGKWNERAKQVPTGAFHTTFGDPRNETWDGHDFVELSTGGLVAPSLEGFARVYWDGVRYHGIYVYGPDTSTTLNFDRGDGDRMGFETRGVWSPLASQVWTAGLEGARSTRVWLQNFDDQPYAEYTNVHLSDNRLGVYGQVEQRLTERLRLTAGTRWDVAHSRQCIWSPRADLVWRADEATTLKLLFGQAFHEPDPYQTQYDGLYALANPDLESERSTTTEVEIERRLGAVTATLGAYKNWIRQLIDVVTADTLGNLQYRNGTAIGAQGVEGEMRYQTAGGLRARASLTLQSSDLAHTDMPLSDSPTWGGSVVVTRATERDPLTLGLGFRFLSPRLTLAGTHTGTVTMMDARVGYRAWRGWELAWEAHNLLDDRYGDPASPEHLENDIPEDPRAIYLSIRGWPGSRP